MQQRYSRVRFTEREAEYLMETKLGRIATASLGAQPHVVPVVYEFDGTYFYFGGWNLSKSLKFRNIKQNEKVALVVDDLASVNPWRPRGVEVRGTAEVLDCQNGQCVRITPVRKASWGL